MKDISRSGGARRRPGVAVGVLVALATVGCVSPQVLRDKDNEIATLREERTRLKKELRDKDSELQALELALADAGRAQPIESAAPLGDFQELRDQGIDVSSRDGNLVISIPAEITFASGKAELSKQGREALTSVARRLSRDYGGHVYWVEGHTDTDPISKSKFESNRALSIARAMSVLHFLVEDCGIPDSQCVVAGHGEYQPLAANSSSSGKAKNRRVEIVVHAPGH